MYLDEFNDRLDNATYAVLAAFDLKAEYLPDTTDLINTALESLLKPLLVEVED